MAKLNPLGTPGVYVISYKDPEYNPQTKIVEGTTGQRYASNYMGARSRWWDISMKQAVYEAGQIDAFNKAIDAEIKQINESIADIQRDYAKRYDAMKRHHDTMTLQREKFNADLGPVVTVTTGSGTRPGGRGSVSREGAARNYKISRALQEKTVNEKTLDGKITAIEKLISSADLGADKYSQDMIGYYAVQQQAELLSNKLQGTGMDRDKADALAEAETLKQFDANRRGKNLANRYRDVVAKAEEQKGTGGQYDFTRTATKYTGKKKLGVPEFKPPKSPAEEIAQLKVQEALARGRRKEPLDLIARTRAIQREKFGPSITQAFRELPGEIRRLRQPEGLGRELSAIQRYLEAGGTMEDLQRMITPPETIPRYMLEEDMKRPVPVFPEDELSVEQGVAAPREGYFTTPEMRRRAEIEAEAQRMIPAPLPNIGQPRMMSTAPAPTGMGLELGTRPGPGRPMTDEELRAARRSILPQQEFYPGVPMRTEEDILRQEIEAGMPRITPPRMTDEEIEAARSRILPRQEFYPGVPMDMGDTEVRSTAAPTELLEATSPATEEAAPGGGLRKPPGEKQEKPKQKKTSLPEPVQHRGNLLQGFTAAAGLLAKPKALDRKTANAPAGSPQQFARAIIDAERGKSPTERRPLKDLVANVAQQYNQMGDKKGRDAALENTIALYKLFLDETSLLG